jgi:putative DNA primase/helicase
VTKAPTKPEIEVVKHELDRMTIESEKSLVQSSLPIYQRYGEIVRVRRGDRLLVEPTPQPHLLRLMSMSADWFTWIPGKRKDDPPQKEPVKPPADVVSILFVQGMWKFSELLRVYDAPTLRPDGTVLQDPGYDAATKAIYAPRIPYPRVKDAPSYDDAMAALDKLHWPVHEFPWKHGTDFSTFIALLLTVVGRPSVLGPTPMFVVRATDRSIGKSKLVQVVNLIATGAPAATMSYQDDPVEEGKAMLALGRESTPLALMDNVALPLGGDVLAMCLTSTTYKGRELGVTRMLEVPVPVLCATGVNVMVKDDLGRRVLPIDLDPPTPDWKKRAFKIRDLERWTLDHRAELAHAALTILRAFHAAGCPQTNLDPYASYESWTERVRAVCVWLGLPDPVLGNERFAASGDLDRDATLNFLQHWHDRFGPLGSTIGEALELARSRDTELFEAMLLLDPKCTPDRFDSRRAMTQFQKIAGRFVGGYRLETIDRKKRGAVWAVLEARHLTAPNVTPLRHPVNPFGNGVLGMVGDAVLLSSISMVPEKVLSPDGPTAPGPGAETRSTLAPQGLTDEGERRSAGAATPNDENTPRHRATTPSLSDFEAWIRGGDVSPSRGEPGGSAAPATPGDYPFDPDDDYQRD